MPGAEPGLVPFMQSAGQNLTAPDLIGIARDDSTGLMVPISYVAEDAPHASSPPQILGTGISQESLRASRKRH